MLSSTYTNNRSYVNMFFMYRHMQTQNEDTHSHTCFDSYLHRHTYIHLHAYTYKNM